MSEQAREEAARAQGLLRKLADSSSPPAHTTAQAVRERLTASIEAELARLVKQRARNRRWTLTGVAAVAASSVLAWSLGGSPAGTTSVTISREPALSAPAARPAALPRPSSPPPAYPEAPEQRREPRPSRAAPAAAVSQGFEAESALAQEEAKSSLAQENEMFKRAVDADRRGDSEEAVRLLDQLARKHSRSPLAQTAAVLKFRVLAKAGRQDDARLEANRYLSTYPTGFAVEEARALQPRALAAPSASRLVRPEDRP